jgi:hypothetical protein
MQTRADLPERAEGERDLAHSVRHNDHTDYRPVDAHEAVRDMSTRAQREVTS